MSKPRTDPARALPRWVKFLAGTAIAFHLLAVVALALAAPSGPWNTSVGPSPALGPQFAQVVAGVTTERYLKYLRMTHNYHYATDRPEQVGIYFEVTLKDDKGGVLKTLKFPETAANPWVRHREYLLALGLANDQPIQAKPGEDIPAPKQQPESATYWDNTSAPVLRLKTVPEHLLPRPDPKSTVPPPSRPAEWSLVLARSYSRYLCRQYGAASAEVVRYSRDTVRPELIFMPQPPARAFTTLVSHFGEVKRED